METVEHFLSRNGRINALYKSFCNKLVIITIYGQKSFGAKCVEDKKLELSQFILLQNVTKLFLNGLADLFNLKFLEL